MSMSKKTNEYIKVSMSNHDVAFAHLAGNGAIAELEHHLCSFYGAKHALCVDSATNGLMYLLLATGLKKSEILTTSLSFGGTIAGALTLECSFSFADIDEALDISPTSILEILKKRPRIKAIIAVDFGGQPHQMLAIHNICENYGIWHFVDAAQSMGAEYPYDNIATLNDAMVVSFGPGKTLFAGGEGGAIITNNTELYNRLVATCQHPHRQEKVLGIGRSHEFALNGRMHPIAAMLACDSFFTDMIDLHERRESYNKALSILESFNSVSSTLIHSGSTFYHCPFVVEDPWRFEKEFKYSGLELRYYYTKASWVSLPEQLQRIGIKRKIKDYNCSNLENIINKLYLLHLRP